MAIKVEEAQDLISGIPCQSRLKKKPTKISLKIMLINGLVQNVNSIYALIYAKDLELYSARPRI